MSSLAMCIKFQKQVGVNWPLMRRTTRTYPLTCHLVSKYIKKVKHVCGSSQDCECRSRLPDRPRKKARMRFLMEDNKGFQWNGKGKEQSIVEVMPKRLAYDLFQNVSCPAISESKLTCNSNVSIITDGSIGQYQFKHNMLKSTQHAV
jgi:hypothetical protein